MNILTFAVQNIQVCLHITEDELSMIDSSPCNKAAYEGLFLYAVNLSMDAHYPYKEN